ncbi:transporter [Candidatus Binatus sp.]|uniref:transporter n=1 Tax=Candidatus Binatus sp. TaxID=2811406 RepID=UPI003CC67D37
MLSAFLVAPVHAQQAPTPAQSPTTAMTAQELAISVHNPFQDFVKVPIQSTTGFQLGRDHKAGDGVNIEPLLPFSLNSDWDLIARPSLTVAYAPTPHEQTGLTDLQTSFFLTPAKETTWIWGAGPIFQFPTASSSELGTGRWSTGPTAAVVYTNGPWFGGLLAYHLMSFAGNRARGSVNQTYVEPMISYNLESGWYADIDPQMTYDWTADTANAWLIPMGADVGKAFNIGSQSLSLQAGAYDLLKRPDGAPQWIMRVSVTFLFPAGY